VAAPQLCPPHGPNVKTFPHFPIYQSIVRALQRNGHFGEKCSKQQQGSGIGPRPTSPAFQSSDTHATSDKDTKQEP
jgi:hypothetical protein